MNNLIPIILGYFLYSFAMTIVKNRNRKNTLKMLIDNNLVNNSATDIKLNFLTVDEKKSSTNYILPAALGLMGFALGLVIGSYMIAHLSVSDVPKDQRSWYDIKDAIQLGAPLFFASIGVTIAYFIEKKNQK